MLNAWVLTNHNSIDLSHFSFTHKASGYVFAAYSPPEPLKALDRFLFVSGTIYNLPPKDSTLNQAQGICIHCDSSHNNSTSVLNGNYSIVQLNKDSFTIHSDFFGIEKYFIYSHESIFIISNSLSLIAKTVKLSISKNNCAIYSLLYHYTGGITAFNSVSHNSPAQLTTFSKNSGLTISTYANAYAFFQSPESNVSIAQLSDSLLETITSQLDVSDSSRISLSLTGGTDTRNLLALLLKVSPELHAYTYGSPLSNDCVKARLISDTLNINHSVHDIKMSESLFSTYARRIIREGQTLASIHRAHRLMAIEYERPNAEVMFLGTLGGEFVRGVSEDDYITPSLVYENWSREIFQETITGQLLSKGVKLSAINVESIRNFVEAEPYCHGSVTERKFYSLSHITAHLHDAQDLNLYRTVFPFVFTPFLDVNYLTMLFESKFSFLEKEKMPTSFLRRLDNPLFSAKLLALNNSELLRIPYAGEHYPADVLINKYYAGIKKLVSQRLSKSYPPNFPLGPWMNSFVKRNLELCMDYAEIRETFNLEKMLLEVSNLSCTKESCWLKYTSPIMMRLIIEEYLR